MALPPSADAAVRPNLYGLDRDALAEWMQSAGTRSFHGGQVFRWLYTRRRFDPAEWTDLPAALRARLAEDTRVDPGRLADRVTARDGTVKYRVELAEGGSVEAVYMEHGRRVTLCISSQVGCALGCDFCLTARMGLLRHLAPGEIAGQVALVQEDRELCSRPFNVVFMGMGEPLHNYDGVLSAFRLLTDPAGFALAPRRITVSTSGIAPAIERLAREPRRPRLAVSLNATTDAVRNRLMPVNRKYPLERLLGACRAYRAATGDRFTLEYVLLDGVNDTAQDLVRLARIVRGLGAKLNLIPFNEVPGELPYRAPTRARVLTLRDRLLDAGVAVSVRWSRGVEARAACGQLALPRALDRELHAGGSA